MGAVTTGAAFSRRAPILQVSAEPNQGSPLGHQAQPGPDLARALAAEKMPLTQQCANGSPRGRDQRMSAQA